MKSRTEIAAEQAAESNLSLKMVLDANPQAAELFKLAFMAGFVDGSYWQATETLKNFDKEPTQECAHQWARRRDGRRCHLCEKVEFGTFV